MSKHVRISNVKRIADGNRNRPEAKTHIHRTRQSQRKDPHSFGWLTKKRYTHTCTHTHTHRARSLDPSAIGMSALKVWRPLVNACIQVKNKLFFITLKKKIYILFNFPYWGPGNVQRAKRSS